MKSTLLAIILVITASCGQKIQTFSKASVVKKVPIQVTKSVETKVAKKEHRALDFKIHHQFISHQRISNKMTQIIRRFEPLRSRLTFPKMQKSSQLFVVSHPIKHVKSALSGARLVASNNREASE